MHYVYAENEPRTGGRFVLREDANANLHWANHTYNLTVLKIFHAGTRDARELSQINREIEICERKRKYWMNHENFDLRGAEATYKRQYERG